MKQYTKNKTDVLIKVVI